MQKKNRFMLHISALLAHRRIHQLSSAEDVTKLFKLALT